MQDAGIVAAAAFTVLALALTAVAFRSWARTRSGKLLLLAAAFTLFLVKGVVVSWTTVRGPSQPGTVLVAGLVLDAAALALLYAAVLRRD